MTRMRWRMGTEWSWTSSNSISGAAVKSSEDKFPSRVSNAVLVVVEKGRYAGRADTMRGNVCGICI